MDDGEGKRYDRARICIDFGTALSKASICLDPLLPLEVGVKPLPIGAISRAEHPLLTPSGLREVSTYATVPRKVDSPLWVVVPPEVSYVTVIASALSVLPDSSTRTVI